MKIRTEYVKYLICMLPFLEMPRWGGIPSVNQFFLVWKIISAIMVCMLMVTKGKMNKLDIVFILYCGTIVLSTVLNKGEVLDSISDMLALVVPFLLFELYMDQLPLNKLLMPIIVLIVLYGLITAFQLVKIPFYILYVQGMRDEYSFMLSDTYGPVFALGSLKRFGFMMIPALLFVLLIEHKNIKSKVIIVFVSILTVFLLLYSWSIACLFTVIGILIAYYLLDSKILSKFFSHFNAKLYFVIFLALNYLLLMMPFLEKFNQILGLFGKTTTLSGRTYVWDLALQYISQKPLLGYGINRGLTASRFWDLVHMHNLLLNSAYEGGMIALCFMIYILYLVSKQLANNYRNSNSKILTVALIGFYILSLADTPEHNMFFLLFPLMYSVDKLKIE